MVMENQEQVVEQAPQAQPELSIVDLQNIKAILETAVRRGAFQASEMSPIGAVYDRLNTFLTAVLPKKEETAQTAE